MKEKQSHSCNTELEVPEGRRHTASSHKRGDAIRKKDVVEVHTRLRKDDLASLYGKLRNTI